MEKNRLDILLSAIANKDVLDDWQPLNRLEQYLLCFIYPDKIQNLSSPLNRLEQYLFYILTKDYEKMKNLGDPLNVLEQLFIGLVDRPDLGDVFAEYDFSKTVSNIPSTHFNGLVAGLDVIYKNKTNTGDDIIPDEPENPELDYIPATWGTFTNPSNSSGPTVTYWKTMQQYI